MTQTKDERAARLKAALRANLRRRKAQERERFRSRPAPGDVRPGPVEADADGTDGGPDSDKSGL
jgi:hypothetical protein